MAAITAAEKGLSSVLVLEATSKPLEKVRISGGGRCNVTHACWTPQELVLNYPRGSRPLLSTFSRFAPGDVVSWFHDKGLDLIIESDGRMFPASNSSLDVVACLKNSASLQGVHCHTKTFVENIAKLEDNSFLITTRIGKHFKSKNVLIATGGHPSGIKLASDLGHRIIKPVPSLFSFTLKDKPLNNYSGLTINKVYLKLILNDSSFEETGPIIFTHWGLSGPAILRLSAFAARDLFFSNYHAILKINWLAQDISFIRDRLKECRYLFSRNMLINAKPFEELPRRLWIFIIEMCGVKASTRWSDLNLSDEKKLLDFISNSQYHVKGKGPFGAEFVTAGGVSLGEVNLKTMESRLCTNLFFSGEILDVDGITGGFNFQHCWTSGWLAGNAISR